MQNLSFYTLKSIRLTIPKQGIPGNNFLLAESHIIRVTQYLYVVLTTKLPFGFFSPPSPESPKGQSLGDRK